MPLSQRAPAKINLGLHVLRQRPDGYHDIETVLHRIDWADTIRAAPADTLSMTCSDPALPTDTDNLCLQAAHCLAEAFDVTAGAALHLEKQVPYGAGLGSGSSDAAATLRLLSELWELDPPPGVLHDIGASIGSDVPFFLQNAPAAYATGRGNRLSAVSPNATPYQLPFPLLVAAPPVEVSTPRAYAHVRPSDAGRPSLPDLVASNDLERWCTELQNDFEAPVVAAEPTVAAARSALHDTDAAYVSLAGSGGALYGLYETAAAARDARTALQSTTYRAHLTMPEGTMPEDMAPTDTKNSQT
jgi:4-diphosphocytidyl-2-C-methyl-D-erythritol kinase